MTDASFLAPKFENIPAGLKAQPWAVWIAEPRTNQPGKFNKAPRSPLNGQKVGANKPHLFGTYDEAMAAYGRGGYTGVGVLLTGNGLIGIDIDDYEHTFKAQPAVREWVREALGKGAYCEGSPSRQGLRLFVRGMPLSAGRKSGNLEIYDNKRFLTVTGHVIRPGGADA